MAWFAEIATSPSRQINLIDLPCTKNARRIFAIVSKISIPTSASKNHGSHCGPSVPGSRLDADHAENGVLIHADSHSRFIRLPLSGRFHGIATSGRGAWNSLAGTGSTNLWAPWSAGASAYTCRIT